MSVAGELPIAVTTKLKVKVVSKFESKRTLFILDILASIPSIEYVYKLQSGLLYENGVINKSVV